MKKDGYSENTIATIGNRLKNLSKYVNLENLEEVKTFIIVTDEEENRTYDGKYMSKLDDPKSFSSIFKQYWDDVYKAKLVFVSFVPDNRDGMMVTQLKKMIPGIEKNIIQFRLNKNKPDLRKMDGLLNSLEMESDLYGKMCEQLTGGIKDKENKIGCCIDMIKKCMSEDDEVCHITI